MLSGIIYLLHRVYCVFPATFYSDASKVICGFKEEFSGDKIPPYWELCHVGVANGMFIEGMGTVELSFKSNKKIVVIHT